MTRSHWWSPALTRSASQSSWPDWRMRSGWIRSVPPTMLPFLSPLATSSSLTKMQLGSAPTSLWNALTGIEDLTNSALCGAYSSVALHDLVHGSALDGRGEEL